MNQRERHEQFDIEAIRKKVAQIGLKGDSSKNADARPLNAFASQIARQFAADSHKPVIVTGTMRILEAMVPALLFLFIVFADAPMSGYGVAGGILLAVASAMLTALAGQLFEAYQIPLLFSARRSPLKILLAWTTAAAMLGGITALSDNDVMRDHAGAVGIWFVAVATGLAVERVSIAFAIRKWARNGFMERRAVIIGGGNAARELIRALEAQPDNDIRICGIFDDRDERRSPDMVAGYPKLGTFEELVEFARQARIDIMIISLPLSAEARILELLKKLWILPVDIRIAAHASKLRFRPRAYSRVGDVSMLDIFDRPITDWDSVSKRIFDIFFSLVALSLVWPIMLAAAIAVKATSKGPVLFVQKRHGFNNQEVNVYKFRSMYTEMSDPSARQAVTKNDPRVTPVGRFLRKSSIDELPQLFNVLQGTLSLVGPRPHAILAQSNNRKYADVVESYFARHKVKPGVTGWAQINGWRGEIDNDDKIKFRTAYDLYYIENWSLWLDLKILFLTPFRLLNTENAY